MDRGFWFRDGQEEYALVRGVEGAAGARGLEGYRPVPACLARSVVARRFHEDAGVRSGLRRLHRELGGGPGPEPTDAQLLAAVAQRLEGLGPLQLLRRASRALEGLALPRSAPAPDPRPRPREGATQDFLVRLYDVATGEGVAGLALEVELPSGERRRATTDAGGLARVAGLPRGTGACALHVALSDAATVDTTWSLEGHLAAPRDALRELRLHGSAPAAGARRSHVARVSECRVQQGDTLERLAEECAVDLPTLLRFNFGTDADAEVQRHLRDHVGCTRQGEDGRSVFTGHEVPGVLFVPRPVRLDGLSVGRTHHLALQGVVRTEERLESRLALDALTRLAGRMEEAELLTWLLLLYGADVPQPAYAALRQDLLDGALPPPPLRVVTAGLGGHAAGYERQGGVILVDRALVLRAEEDAEARAQLLLALLEEFGHHVDDLLRTRYSDVGGDAQLDEGARFASALFTEWLATDAPVAFATWLRDGTSRTLEVDFPEVRRSADTWLSEAHQQDDATAGSVEYFGAGRGHGAPGVSFGHQSIEDALQADFDAAQRREIYFGNWLRDYSQVIDPKLVRPPGSRKVLDGPFTRGALTRVLDVMAREEFRDGPEFRVTEARLGLYRPEEHIDNPHGIEDGRGDDPAFYGGNVPGELAVDLRTGLLAYIASPGPWKSAVGSMEQELRGAVAAGPSAEGRRRFGGALHVLEDFFSHSNFVELALLRLGHTGVCPWVWHRKLAPTLRFPLTTGKFGGDDTQVSLLYAAAGSMQQEKECKAGERGTGTEIALILLGDIPTIVPPEWTRRFDGLMRRLEDFYREHPTAATMACRTSEFLTHWLSALQADYARARAEAVMRAQTEHLASAAVPVPPTSPALPTHPTHSQLAKDHDDHPLHALAAQLAMRAVEEVGRQMKRAWTGAGSADAVVATARRHFVHPEDIQPVAADPRSWMLDRVRDWARAHPAVLPTLTKEAMVASTEQHTREHSAALQRTFEQQSGLGPQLAARLAELSRWEERA